MKPSSKKNRPKIVFADLSDITDVAYIQFLKNNKKRTLHLIKTKPNREFFVALSELSDFIKKNKIKN